MATGIFFVGACNRQDSKSVADSASGASVKTASAKADDRPAIPVGSGGFFDLLKPSEAKAQEGGESWTADAPVTLDPKVIQKISTSIEDRIGRPGITVQVQNFRKSSIKGLLIGDAVLNAQGKTVTQVMYSSIDGRWVTLSSLYKLGKVTAGDFPGFKIVEFNALGLAEDDEDRTQKIMVSDDGQFVTFAEWTDTDSDPRAERMKLVSLDGIARQGAKNGKVTIVEFSDFQCPFCDRAAKTMRKEVYPAYKDKVTFYFKHLPLPFHKWADDAAIAALCVKRDGSDDDFWKLYDFYFENQKVLDEGNIKDQTYRTVAKLGVNQSKFKSCFENRETQKELERDMAEAAALDISGTPGFLVNGKKMSGAQPFAAFKSEIDAILASK